MKKLFGQINELEKHVANYKSHQATVSAGTVGWHIEHSLMVFISIITTMENSNPANFKSSFKMNKFLVYFLNKIPRGKARAPKIVQPDGEIIPEKLMANIQTVKTKIQVLTQLQKNHHFPHPYFGDLNLKETIKFLGIHTNHHLKIINDILKAA